MKRAIVALTGGLIVAALLSLFAFCGPGRRLEWMLYDLSMQVRRDLNPRPWHSDTAPIRIIQIDDESINQVEEAFGQQWPWPRNLHAALVQILSHPDFRPRAIGFDVLFRKRTTADSQSDAALVATVRGHGGVALGYRFEVGDAEGDVAPLSALPPELARMKVAEEGKTDALRPAGPKVPWLELAEAGWPGFYNAPRDADGVLRRVPLVMDCGGSKVPSLALATAMRALNCEPDQVTVRGGRAVRLGPEDRGAVDVPIDHRARALVNYPDRWEAVKAVSFWRVLRWGARAGEDPEARAGLAGFKDKVVLVGMAYEGVPDAVPTPLDRLCPGVAVHAAVVNSILTGDFLRDCPPWVDVAWIAVVSLAAAALATWPRPRWAGPGVALLILGVFGAGFATFSLGRVVWTATPVLAGVVSFSGLMAFRQMVTDRRRRRLRRLFGQYLSTEAVNEIVGRADRVALGGRRMPAVVLFSDIRGFTTLTEDLGAEPIVALLNEYLDAMTEVIQKHGGAVNKFVGDEIFATFGVPVEHADDCLRAVRAAIEMQQRLAGMRLAWKEQGKPQLRMGVGISRGDVVAGTLGSERRKDYTAIGDAVNLGSRLQELTKEYGEPVLVCCNVWDKIRDQVSGRPIGEVSIRGRVGAMRVFAIDVPDA